jgi:hypothetical protein
MIINYNQFITLLVNWYSNRLIPLMFKISLEL